MYSNKALLHRLTDADLTRDEEAEIRCKLAAQLEQGGNYEAAREAMGPLWRRVGERPALEGLSQQTVADLLLRAGALTRDIGSAGQIEGAHEAAKDLLTESASIFESLGLGEKAAEVKTELAYCYWREGRFDDARVILQEVRGKLFGSENHELKAVAMLRSAMVEGSSMRFNDALRIYLEAEPIFEKTGNDVLRGKFHHGFGFVLRNLSEAEERKDYLDRALIEYAAAGFYFDKAGLSRFQACVENNLGFLFATIRKFSDAHDHLDRAQALFTRLHDKAHGAQVDETRARVLIAEGEFAKAEKFVNAAVRVLEKGGEQSLLAEALTTQGIVLAKLKQYEKAAWTIHRASQVAEQAGDLESAGKASITLIEQLGHHLSNDQLCGTIERAGTLLEKCRHFGIIRRLERVERQVIFLTNAHPGPPDWSTFILDEVQQRNQCRYVELALRAANGSVTDAAKLLKVQGHQTVNRIINSRCPHLVEVRKPIKQRRRSIIHSELSSDSTHAREGIAAGSAKILCVEDDEIVARMLKEMLELQGFEVETCSDGAEALKRISEGARYDLLLVDYLLQEVNGLEIVGRVKRMAQRASTPIVVLSATPVAAAARDAGADAFLQKPQDLELLVETITRLLDKREQEGRDV